MPVSLQRYLERVIVKPIITKLTMALISLMLSITVSAAASNPSLVAKDYFSGSEVITSTNLDIKELSLSISLNGNYAETAAVVEFSNPTERQLEGDFKLEMPIGSIVTGYGLDINGELIDGVIVERKKATKVFEDRIREGVDPGLGEVTSEDVFKSRVFPIEAGMSRTISVTFVSPISKIRPYRLPLASDDVVEKFSLVVTTEAGVVRPVVRLQDGANLHWKDGSAPVGLFGTNGIELNSELEIIPRNTSNYALETNPTGEMFLSLNVPDVGGDGLTSVPKSIRVLWDTSLSQEKAAKIGQDFLARVLKAYPEADLEVVTFNSIADHNSFDANKSASALLNYLSDIKYHGATNLEALFLSEEKKAPADVCLLITDGRTTLGSTPSNALACRLFTINVSAVADRSLLKFLAKANGGHFIDLSKIEIEEGLELLSYSTQKFQRLIVDGRHIKNDVEWVFDGDVLRLTAPITRKPSRLKVEFEDRSYRASVNSARGLKGNILGAIWASQKLSTLRAKNAERKEVVALSKRYSVAVEETSFLVLESVDDYVENRIALPGKGFSDEDRRRYDNQLADAVADDRAVREERITDVLEMWNEQVAWYEASYKGDFKQKSVDLNASGPSIDSPVLAQDAIDEDAVIVTGSRVRRSDLNAPSPVASVESEQLDMSNRFSTEQFLNTLPEALDGNADPVNTLINRWSPDRPYLDKVRGVCGQEFLDVFFEQRVTYGTLPSYYLEMADAIEQCGDQELALNVVLSALELDATNTDTITAVAHRLVSYGAFDFAESLFRRVTKLDPDRPQPWRDLALALEMTANQSTSSRWERRKIYQEAIGYLNHIIENPWDVDYDGIELIAIMDANNIDRRLRAVGGRKSNLDTRFRRLLDVDLRVVVTWNVDIVDMDLWVDEPTGERANYSNDRTSIGGRISNDMTEGYGPEEYLLRRAVPGDYEIRMDYYSSDIINPNGAIALRAKVFRNWGRSNETSEIIDLEFTEVGQDDYLVGTLSYN